MDGKVEIDIDRQFREEGELVVQVSCRRVWLLRWRLTVFGYLVRFVGFLTRLRVTEIVAEIDDGEES